MILKIRLKELKSRKQTNKKEYKLNWAWWYRPVISVLRRLRQEEKNLPLSRLEDKLKRKGTGEEVRLHSLVE
jgi:hypothetical protein